MPSFISDGGTWYPKKEQVGLINKSNETFEVDGKEIHPGDHFIYEGPDREALKMLAEAGEETLGQNFTECSEFQNFINQKHQGNTKQYLKRIGYKAEEAKKAFDEMASVVSKHELPARVKEIYAMGGGKDVSGAKANDVIGGFGSERVRSPKELKVS